MLSEEDNAGVSPESAAPASVGEVEGGGEEIQTLQQPTYSDAEAAALQELVQHSIGSLSSDNIEALPDPESIEKISNEKIKAMRRLTVDSAEVLPPFQEQVAETLILGLIAILKRFFSRRRKRKALL